MVLRSRSRLSTVKTLDGFGRAHLEIMRGGLKSAVEYCHKESTRVAAPKEYGSIPLSGDAESVISKLKNRNVRDLLEEDPKLWRSVRMLKEAKRAILAPRDFETEGLFLTGPTGTGKSRLARLIASFIGESCWVSDGTLQWFDPYQGEDVCICDDVTNIETRLALRMCDRYPLEVPIKGSFMTFCPKLVLFTSNFRMVDVFRPGQQEPALNRRVRELYVY